MSHENHKKYYLPWENYHLTYSQKVYIETNIDFQMDSNVQ